MKEKISIFFDAVWSNDISYSQFREYSAIQNEVFGIDYTGEKFSKKFLCNIYGDSLFVFAKVDQLCVGAMVFWRNDIYTLKAYQPCEMAVVNKYRGYGIFPRMNAKGLEFIGDDCLFYNFPNDNSLPSYMKMGWFVHSKQRYKIFNPFADAKDIPKIDEGYLDWLLGDANIKNIEYLGCFVFNKKYYLIQQKKWCVYIVIAEVSEKNSRKLKRVNLPFLLHYSSRGYMGRGVVRVTNIQNGDIDIPLYKIGPLF